MSEFQNSDIRIYFVIYILSFEIPPSVARCGGDGVLFAERANEFALRGRLRNETSGGIVKASLIRAFMIAWTRPEAGRATYEQGEAAVKRCGGPNPRAVQHSGMTCV